MANFTSTVQYCDVMFICDRRKGLSENIIGSQAVKETRQYKITIKRFPVKKKSSVYYKIAEFVHGRKRCLFVLR